VQRAHVYQAPRPQRREDCTILAAERGMTAGRLARQLLMKTVDEEAKAAKR
jgi:hypothetical protein